MFKSMTSAVALGISVVAIVACVPAARIPPVHEPLDSEEWKRCAGELEKREAATMMDDLTLDSKTMLCQGVVLAASGNVEKGLELLAESGFRDKEDHRPHYLAGRILAENGRYEEALTEFERAYERFSSIEIPAERIGRNLVQKNKDDEARGFLEKAFERKLCSYGCMGLLGKLHSKAGEDDKARTVYKKMIGEDPSEPAAYIGLAGIENRASEYRAEADFLKKAIAADKFKTLSASQRADVHYSLAFAKYNAEEYIDADRSIGDAISLAGDRADWYVLEGWIELKRDRLESALKSFQKAQSLDRTLAAAFTGEGDAWMALGDPQSARKKYETAMGLDPVNAVIVLKLAYAVALLKDFQEAKRLVDEAVRMDKDHLPPDLLRKVTDLLPN